MGGMQKEGRWRHKTALLKGKGRGRTWPVIVSQCETELPGLGGAAGPWGRLQKDARGLRWGRRWRPGQAAGGLGCGVWEGARPPAARGSRETRRGPSLLQALWDAAPLKPETASRRERSDGLTVPAGLPLSAQKSGGSLPMCFPS